MVIFDSILIISELMYNDVPDELKFKMILFYLKIPFSKFEIIFFDNYIISKFDNINVSELLLSTLSNSIIL